MTDLLLFVAAKLAVLSFGAPAAFLAESRTHGRIARLAIAYVTGCVVLTAWALALSYLHVRWTPLTLGAPLIAAAIAGIWLVRRYSRPVEVSTAREPLDVRIVLSGVVTALALAHVFFSIIATRMTSADYLYFWGAKATRFAQAGGIDLELLRNPLMMHLHPTYPPLVTVNYAWDNLVMGRMAWRVEMLNTWLWFAATVVVLYSMLSHRIGRRNAAPVVAFWSMALGIGLEWSFTAGNAESPLVLFAVVAAMALLPGTPRPSVLAVVALVGCVWTKTEGTVLWLVLAAAAATVRFGTPRRSWIRDLAAPVLVPAAALGAWFLFEWLNGLPTSDPTRERAFAASFSAARQVIGAMLWYLHGATYWLSWLVPAVVLFASFKWWREAALPAIAALLLLGFYFGYYLHVEPAMVTDMIKWTFPRVSLPSLALWIVAAGLAWGTQPSRRAEL
ncbi:MAG TPA: hypothetical protein VE010_17850, partial [Thermoanaerobaculia bacterium]|nr:hypothetical protein [Thermoanaerobaculia bacterium]